MVKIDSKTNGVSDKKYDSLARNKTAQDKRNTFVCISEYPVN